MSAMGAIKQSERHKEVEEAIFNKELEEDLSGEVRLQQRPGRHDGQMELGGTWRAHFMSREPQVRQDRVKQDNGREGLGPYQIWVSM